MILQSKLKCDNYPALIEKGTHREINDPHPRKEVQLHSNLSAVNLLPYVLSNRGLFAPVCLSKEQLVSWPLEAVKASSFHWNRWHAGAENHSAIFIPRASKSTLRYHSSPILSEITESKDTAQVSWYICLLLGWWKIALGVFREGKYYLARMNTEVSP